MNSLYELDLKWRNLLSPDNFLGGLTVHEFVEELSKDQIQQRSTDDTTEVWKKLDAKPYIRTFESVLREMEKITEHSANQKMIYAEQVATEELKHSNNVLHVSKNLNQTLANYDDLDNKLSNVIQIVSPLGEKVENAVRKKKVYIKSVELLTQYNSFYENENAPTLDAMLGSHNWQENLRAAIIVKNLLILSAKVETNSIPHTGETTRIIEKYSESMETKLLEDFNNAYHEKNFTKLNEIALILNHFNGGVNVIQSFINQHSFFIDTAQVGMDGHEQIDLDENFKNKLMDVDYHGILYENNLVELTKKIQTIIMNESEIVKEVFEKKATNVLSLFIQRIFNQKLETKVDYLLSSTFTLSDLAHVRMLHASYTLIGQLVKDLTSHFEELNIDNYTDLASVIEQCYSDLFSKYLYDRSRYFDIERRSLETILIKKTSAFNISHEKETHNRALANKLSNKIETNSDMHDVTNISKGKMSQINNFFKTHLEKDRLALNSMSPKDGQGSNRGNKENGGIQNDIVVDEAEFNVQNANLMLKCVVESIARVMELTPNRSSEYSHELLELLHVGLISSYVETALEVTFYEILRVDVAKVTEINISFLKYISISTEILSLISASVKAVFLPLLNNAPDIKKKITEMTNKQLKRCEHLINTTMEELTKLFSYKFVDCLSKQKRKDFIPKSQDLIDHDTVPAVEIVVILNSLFPQAQLYLKNENLTSFLKIIGEILYNMLLSHYGKFQVSSTGGIIVTKDIIGYQNAIEEWNIQELSDKFATLRELANLFVVQAELLDSLTKEGHLVNVSRSVVKTYISNRDDFNHEKFMNGVKLNFK